MKWFLSLGVALTLMPAVAEAAVWKSGTFGPDRYNRLPANHGFGSAATVIDFRLLGDSGGGTIYWSPSFQEDYYNLVWDGFNGSTERVSGLLGSYDISYSIIEPEHLLFTVTTLASYNDCNNGTFAIGEICGFLASVRNNDGIYGIEGATKNVDYEITFTLITPVPEPATWAMMIVGFGMAGAMLRRRQPSVMVMDEIATV